LRIRVENLRFAYPGRGFRLSPPPLDIAPGQRVAFVGPSGSGKTTLLRLIAGILTPDAGSVFLGDTEISALSDRERRRFRASRIGFVFQDFRLLDHLDVRENVRLPLRLSAQHRARDAIATRADELLDESGILTKARARPRTLSQGEKQRAAICRALVTRPGLILADEPTGNLDPDNKSKILGLLIDRARAADATLIVVTHDESLLPAFDRVIDFADTLSTHQPEAR